MKSVYTLPILFFFIFNSYTPLHAQCWQVTSAGFEHSVAIKPDRTLWAWGFNGNGQLGDGTTKDRNLPVQIGTGSDWKTVAAGGNHTLAIKTDGTLWAWGDNLWGQVGNGTFGTEFHAPIKIGTASNWMSVFSGRSFSFAIRTDGTLWAWGDNFYGQLGIASSVAYGPTQVGNETTWKSVSGGNDHTLAVKNDGTLWSWGSNSRGELGDGTTTDSATPSQVGTANWSIAAAGTDFSVAIKADGTLWAWGNNASGQLGNGTYTQNGLPAQVGTATNWASAASGEASVQAIKTDGTLWTCGWIMGTSNFNTLLTRVGAATTWKSVVSGDRHTLAFQTDGTLWVWGENTWGKLGDGTWIDQTLPELLLPATPAGESFQTFCGSATVANLTASGTNIKWYSTPTGGSPLSSATSLVSLAYYYASQDPYQCESPARLAVHVFINTTPTTTPTGAAVQTFCGAATVGNLSATGSNIIWYDAPTGGNIVPITTSLTDGTHYYASQKLVGCESATRLDVMAKVNTALAPTGESPQMVCSSGTVSNLIAIGQNIQWYSLQTGGSPLPSSTVLNDYTQYFASQTVAGQESCARLPVLAIVSNTPVTAPTGPSSQEACSGATVASLVASGNGILWYTQASGGSPLSVSTTLTARHYYASQMINQCESSDRLDVNVSINSTPTPQPTGASSQLVCEGSAMNAIAVTGTNVKWYAAATNGAALPSTTSLATDTHYYATQTLNTCESPTRLDVLVTLAPNATQAPLNGNPVRWKTLVTNRNTSLSIKDDGTLWGWGINNDHELADGTNIPKKSPTLIGADTDWETVAGGAVHIQALKRDGSLWGWGYNLGGQLGIGRETVEPVPIQTGTETDWKSVATGDYHTVAIKTNGTLWAWGDNYVGVLGNGTNTGRVLVPTQIGTDNHWQYLCAGSYTNFAIKDDGSLWGWGANSSGQLGDGTHTPRHVPTRIGTANAWKMVSTYSNHTVALKNDGTLWAWGSNGSGRLGIGSAGDDQVNPVEVGTDHWKTISAGDTHTLGIKADGTLWAWGDNYGYQLGDGTPSIPDSPSHVYHVAPVQIGTDADWATISAGYFQSLAVKNDGTLWAWGYNGYGEVGDGTTDIINGPKLIPSLSQDFCGSTVLSGVEVIGTNIKWYASLTDDMPLPPSTPLISGEYYFATQTVNTCESVARLGLLMISGGVTNDPPTGPSTQTLCLGSTVGNLKASGNYVRWFASPAGGTAMANDIPLQNGVHYYAGQSIGACQSTSRLEVVVFLNEAVDPPVAIGSTTPSFCDGAQVSDLKAAGSNIKWYTVATGGSPLSVSELLLDNAHYYASQLVNTCESSTRLEGVASVMTTPPPTAAGSQSFCTGATVLDLVATGAAIKWYNVQTGGSPLYDSAPLEAANYYYASQTLNGCESNARITVWVTFGGIDTPTGDSEPRFCSGATIADLVVSGQVVKWYAAAENGTPLPAMTLLSDNTQYFASQTVAGCESTSRFGVETTILTTDPPTGTSPQLLSNGKTLSDLDVSGENILWYATGQDASGNINALNPSTVVTNGATYYATQSVGGCESQTALAIIVALVTGVEHQQTLLTYYPNPVRSSLNLSFYQPVETIVVINPVGEHLITQKVGQSQATVDMSSLPNGQYTLQVNFKTETTSLKIVKY